MKKAFIPCYFLFFIYCLIFYKEIIFLTKDILTIFIQHVFPSLFPMILLSELFFSLGIIHKLMKNHPSLAHFMIVLFTMFLGCPSSLPFLNQLKKDEVISKEERNLLLFSFGGISFPYLYSLLILHALDQKDIELFFILYLVEILFYLFFSIRFRKDRQIRDKNEIKIELNHSIISSLKTFSIIFVTTLLWNYGFASCLSIYKNMSPLSMLIEFSYSGYFVHALKRNESLIFLSFLLSFTSISSFAGISLIDQDFPLLKHMKIRLFLGIFTTLLTLIFLL